MLEEFLKSISIVFYEALCCRIFLDIFLRQRYSFKFVRSLSVCLLSGVFLVWALGTQAQGQYIFRSLGIVFSIFLFSIVFYSGKWQMKLFFSGAFYALLYCVDYFCLIMVDLFFERSFLLNDIIQVILALLSKTVLFIVVLSFDHFWKRKKDLQMEGSAWIMMICFPLLCMIIMIVMLFSFLGREGSAGYLTVSFVIMIMNIVMFGCLRYVSEKERKWNQIQLLQGRNSERMQVYQEVSVDSEEQKRILHDYNNQICCIQGLLKSGKYQEAEIFVDKLTDSFIEEIENVDVHNPIINVVLNQKYRLAKKKEISILFYANDLSDLWLEEQDIVSLLSNLLDNAIEASEKLENNRIIQMKLIRENRQFVLSIRNPVSEPVSIENDQIQTGKEDKKKHGIGLKNVQMVLDKYDGIGMMRYEEGNFYYTAVIPELQGNV